MKVEKTNVDAGSNCVLLHISGRIKSGSLEPLKAELTKLAQSARPVRLIVDVQEVDGIDSSGIGELIKARMEIVERGGNVVLLGNNSRVEMVIKLSGLINHFPVASTKEDAVELVGKPPQPQATEPGAEP